jgi:hypothetical protein
MITARTSLSDGDAWPSLPLAAWQDTCATLHLWSQIVGKTCVALAPWQNHWWHVALHVTARGLTTSPLPFGRHTFEIVFDLVNHHLTVRTSQGTTRRIPLVAQSVADCYHAYLAALAELGLELKLWPVPFRGRFLGKSSPVPFFWGSFDLACTRFSGRAAPPHPGGVPHTPAHVMREAYSHECASCGFWPGGGAVSEPAFYAYAYPAPPGYEAVAVARPAFYSRELGEFILPYEAVRTAARPDHVVLEFLERTYAAAADLARWDRSALERPPETP